MSFNSTEYEIAIDRLRGALQKLPMNAHLVIEQQKVVLRTKKADVSSVEIISHTDRIAKMLADYVEQYYDAGDK